MELLIELIQVSFFQRAIFAGLILGLLAGLLGAFSLMRQSSFFGDAIAHSSLAGVAIGLMLKISPIFTAFVYAGGVATILPWLKSKLNFSYDNLLGIILPFSMGLGIFIFSLLPGYQPEMMSFLFGKIWTITTLDLWLICFLAIFTIIYIYKYYSTILNISLDQTYAKLLGVDTKKMELIYQLVLAFTIITGVKLVGIVLINALLVIPPSIAKIWSRTILQFIGLSVLSAVLLVTFGLLISVFFNVPPGSTIAVLSGLLFFTNTVIKKLFFVNKVIKVYGS